MRNISYIWFVLNIRSFLVGMQSSLKENMSRTLTYNLFILKRTSFCLGEQIVISQSCHACSQHVYMVDNNTMKIALEKYTRLQNYKEITVCTNYSKRQSTIIVFVQSSFAHLADLHLLSTSKIWRRGCQLEGGVVVGRIKNIFKYSVTSSS